MKAVLDFFSGVVLFLVSVWMLLSNIRVNDIHFFSVYGVNSAPILIVLFVVLVVLAVVNGKEWLWTLVILDVIAMIISVILGTRFSLARMSALDLLLILGTLAIGLGLMIKGMIDVRKEDK